MSIVRVAVQGQSNIKSYGFELGWLGWIGDGTRDRVVHLDSGILEVEFQPRKGETKGAVYRYFDVPREVFGRLQSGQDGGSIGSRFVLLIKNGGYRYERVLEE